MDDEEGKFRNPTRNNGALEKRATPSPLDVRAHPAGGYVIRGWHATHQPPLDPSVVHDGGLHVGTEKAARDRAEFLRREWDDTVPTGTGEGPGWAALYSVEVRLTKPYGSPQWPLSDQHVNETGLDLEKLRKKAMTGCSTATRSRIPGRFRS